MIKIIISGTSDGFYPRYASDGVLDDDVSKCLVDRRDYLSKDADRLSKEGFSFQLLSNGILFHKIIPLFDAFGRDGFMMASLFLPEGEMLDGKEIKEALDAIMREYKMHTVGGIANVELDWSFVKRKADELNAKVRQMTWKRRPSQSDLSRTALIKCADNRVAEYFQYPNPLHPDCTGFGQVFLTESLLDPAMASENGEQGYKVIVIDIDNPVYEIIYNNPNGYSLAGLKREVTKKELEAVPGDFYCGVIDQTGFRPQNVNIPVDKKVSSDGMTIEVDLPTLVQKSASVSLKISDLATGKEIPWENCSVNWKGDTYYDSPWEPRIPTGRFYYFEKEECDKTWKVSVECDQYERAETTVTVEDGKKEIPVSIALRHNPTWTIVVTHPIPTKTRNHKVTQDKKDGKISELCSSLESEGLEVKIMPEDRDSRLVSLIAAYPRWTIKIIYGSQNITEKKEVPQNELEKEIEALKKEYEGKSLRFDHRDDSKRIVELYFVKREPTEVSGDTGEHSRRENVFKDPSRNGLVTEPPKEPEMKKWVLQLDDNSKKFSLFSNYKKKSPIVPRGVSYDNDNHRLVYESKQKPNNEFKPKFKEDHYFYLFKEKVLNWVEEKDAYKSEKKHTVKRKLLPKYKFLWFVLPLLVIGVAIALYFFVINPHHNGDDKFEPLKNQMIAFIDTIQNNYHDCYCGDEWLGKGYEIKKEFDAFIGDIDKEEDRITAFQDSVYIVFDGWLTVQEGFKGQDADIYAELEFLKDSIKFWVGKQKTYEMLKEGTNFEDKIACMSNSHKKDVRKWYYERLQEKPEPTGTPHQGIEQHQQVINGPQTLFKASTYNNVTNGYSGYNFVFNSNCNYCIPLKDSIISAVCTKNISELDYNSYYNQAKVESSDKGKVKKLKALLWGENTRNTTELPTEVQPKEPRKITRAQDLFNVLIWDNVCQTRTHFNTLYSLDIGRQTQNYSDKLNDIINIIHTKGISDSTYNEKYEAAKILDGGASDKIDNLLNALRQL